MSKWKFNMPSLLVVLILMYQLVVPFGHAFASGFDTSILPPSNLAYEELTPDDGKLTWSTVYGATGYNVYEIKEGQILLLGSTKTNSYNLNDLPEGEYSYVVSTLTSSGESGPNAPVSTKIVYPDMTAPSSLTSTIKNGNDLVLTWAASQYAQNYNIYEITAEGNQRFITSTTSKTYTVSNAAEGSYHYAISAVNTLYGESSLTSTTDIEVVHPIMSMPEGFSSTVLNGNDVDLKWNAVNFATDYKIYQIVDGKKDLLYTVKTTNMRLTNIQPGEYSYEIHSYSDRFGESAEANKLSVTVNEITLTPPSNFTVTTQNINDVVLKWNSVPYSTGYNVYRVVNGEKILQGKVTGTTVTYPTQPGGNYTYVVSAVSDRFGESQESTAVTVNVETVTMDKPGNFTHDMKNGNDVVLSWEPVTNATNYKVYQIVDGKKVLKSTVTGTTVTYTNLPEGNYVYEVYSNSTRFGESKEGSKQEFTITFPKMLSPENLIQTIKSPSEFALNWDASEFANSYKIYEIVNGQKKSVRTVSTRTTTFSNMMAGNYIYEIHAISSRFGESAVGTRIEVTLNGQIMETPQNLTYTVSNGNDVTFKWDKVQYATTYKVYQMVDGEKILKRNYNATSYAVSNLPEGEHTFEVYAVSTLFGESPVGAVTTFTMVHPEMEKPANTTSKIQNGNDVVLNWDLVPYATSYNVYEVIGNEEVLIRNVTSRTITLADQSEGDHTYVVRSVSNRFGESVEGSIVSLTLVHPIMEAPVGLTQSISQGNNIVLKWTPSTYANGYNIYQVVNGERDLVKFVTGSTHTFVNMPEGDYNFEVHSFSTRFGESPEASKVSLTLVHPIMQAPENLVNTIVSGNDISLRWNSSSFATNYKIYQVFNGEKTLKGTTTGTSAYYPNMPEGDYEYEVYAYSDRFGESAESSKVSFTLVHPIMQAPANPTHSMANGNDIVLRWTTSTYANGYNVYKIVNGEKVFQKKVTSISTSFANMPEGDYTYEIHSYSDRFGESPESSKIELNVTWPIVQAPVLKGTVFNANNMTLEWNRVTWANEYQVYKITEDGKEQIYKGTALSYKVYNLTEDTHSFEVIATSDRFVDSVPSNVVTETIVYPVMQAPVATLTLLSDTSARVVWNFITYANGYNIYEIIDGKQVLIAEKVNNLSYTIQNLSYANHEYVVTSYSNSFGESAPSNVVLAKLIIDTTAPITTTVENENWINRDQSFTLSPTDDETGVAKTFYSVNEQPFVEGTTFTVTKEGSNKVQFYSIDKVGNKEEVKTMDSKIDKTAPITETNEISTNYTQSETVTLTASDELSGVSTTFYSMNGSAFQEGTSITVDQEGTNLISYYSIDHAGNKEEIKTVSVQVDQTAPTTTANVSENWYTDDVSVTLSVEDNLSGVDATYYSINGSELNKGTTFTLNQEGVNEVVYYSIDLAGNKESVQKVTVKIDKTVPVTQSDVAESWTNEDVQVTLTATYAHSGISKTFYSINGSEFQEGTSFTVSQEGISEISYYSVDQAGNREPVQTSTVKIDKTAPVTVSNVTEEWANEDVVVTLTSTDEHSGLSATYFSINGSPYQQGTMFTVKQEGVNTVSFFTTDRVGNREQAQTAVVKIDKTAPELSMNVNELYELGSTVTLTYTATDKLSGIASEVMTVNGTEVKNGSTYSLNKPGTYTVKVTAVDHVGNQSSITKTFNVYIPATIEVTPKVIKGNKGVFTVRVDVPAAFKGKLDLDTATLNGVSALNSNNGYYNQAKNGQFKFERSDFSWIPSEVYLEFEGYVNGYLVIGHTTAAVKK
ncbi:hypothetical protein FZW96_06915 [Bacillus sp. BGMRC 2118]|nr:hypothetical protein FZW96_06915 [Bacillus sp. BGMRC 2118]